MEKVKSPIIPHREPYSLLLTATCPCCGKQVSFAHTTMKPEVEDLIKEEQGKIYIHHDSQCGGMYIVIETHIEPYSDYRCNWLMTDEEKKTYVPRRGDRFIFTEGKYSEIRVITSLPADTAENVLNTVSEKEMKGSSPWGLWFHPNRGKIIRDRTVEDVEIQTGWKFPRFAGRKPRQCIQEIKLWT